MGTLYWILDESGRIVERGQRDTKGRGLFTYDDFGTATAHTDIWGGEEIATNSWNQVNTYDSRGRVLSTDRTNRSGESRTLKDYVYTGDELTEVRSRVQAGGMEHQFSSRLFWHDGQVVARQGSASSIVGSRRRYDRAGRLSELELDGWFGLPDGTPDVRWHWYYDELGRVSRHERDGETAMDSSFVDGKADHVITFDPACADIAVRREELYQLYRWLEPE